MTGGLISLLAVTFAFCALVFWVFKPGNKKPMDAHAQIPFDEPGDEP